MFLLRILLTCCLTLPLAAQVAEGTASLDPTRPSLGDRLSDQAQAAAETAIALGEPVGTVASGEGVAKRLEDLAQKYRYLSEGRGPNGEVGRAWSRSMVEGAEKSGKVEALKAQSARLADSLERLGQAISICDVGMKCAGHLVEGDVSGALIVVPQELAKQLCSKAGAALGAMGGPWGAALGAQGGEMAWKGLGGEELFDAMARKVAYAEKAAEYAGVKVRNPDILAYMRGDLSLAELRMRLAKRQEQILQKDIDRWRGYASAFPAMAGEIDALITWSATDKQKLHLKHFQQMLRLAGKNPQYLEALRAWTEGRTTPEQEGVLRGMLLGAMDGTYTGRASGGGSGTLKLSIQGGKVVGSVIGASEGDGFNASFSGSITPYGLIQTTLRGTLVDASVSEGGVYRFSGTLIGRLDRGRISGTWTAHNEYGDRKGVWQAGK